MADLNSRIDALQKELQSLSQESLKDEDSRKKLLEVTTQCMRALESPLEAVWRMIMAPHQSVCLMALIKAGLLDPLIKGKEPKSAQELASLTGVEELLIVRLMRPLTAVGILREMKPQVYASTPVSESLMTVSLHNGFHFMYSAGIRSLANLPFYLEKTGFKNVIGPPGPFQDARESDPDMSPWKSSLPFMMTQFNDFMSGQRTNHKEWYDLFPADEIIFQGARKNQSTVLLVVVAGGDGHDAQAFQRRFPQPPRKIILQDSPSVIEKILPGQLDPAIECMKHDVLTRQTVRGARVYYFRSIFHEWPDHDCINILTQTGLAMKKGYSKLLIFGWVLPDMDTPLYPALLDINEMAIFNGMERTRKQWTRLLEESGLKVIKFWTIADDKEGLIEAERM